MRACGAFLVVVLAACGARPISPNTCEDDKKATNSADVLDELSAARRSVATGSASRKDKARLRDLETKVAEAHVDAFCDRVLATSAPSDLTALRRDWSVYAVLAPLLSGDRLASPSEVRARLDERTSRHIDLLLQKGHVVPAFQLFEFASRSGSANAKPFVGLSAKGRKAPDAKAAPGAELFEKGVARLIGGKGPAVSASLLDAAWRQRARAITIAIGDPHCQHHGESLRAALGIDEAMGSDAATKLTLVTCEQSARKSGEALYLSGALETTHPFPAQRLVVRARVEDKGDVEVALRSLIEHVRSVLEQDQVARHQLEQGLEEGKPEEYLLALSASQFASLPPLEEKLAHAHGLTPAEVADVMEGKLEPWTPLLEEERWAMLLEPVRPRPPFAWEDYDMAEFQLGRLSPTGWFEMRRHYLGASSIPWEPQLRWQLHAPADRCLEEVQTRFPESDAAVDALLARSLDWRELAQARELTEAPRLAEAIDWELSRSLPELHERVAALKEHARRYRVEEGRFAARAQLLAASFEGQLGKPRQALSTLQALARLPKNTSVDPTLRARALLLEARLLHRELDDAESAKRRLEVLLEEFPQTKYVEAAEWELALIATAQGKGDSCQQVRPIIESVSTTSPYRPCLESLCSVGAPSKQECPADAQLGLVDSAGDP